MENSSGEFMFVLHGLNDTRTNKNIYFAFGLIVYSMTLFINLTLAITVILDKTLHEPMYIFICNLFVNGILGASAFYPKILADLLSEYHFTSYIGCLSQVNIIYSYVFCEYTCLTVMSYDRYVSICKPLEYHSIMTLQKGLKLLILIWLCSLLESTVGILFTAQLPLCGNVIDKLYCSNWEVVKLSCTDVTVNNVYGYFLIFSHVSQAVFIIVSYICIIRASLRSRTQWAKFMQTCLPHLIALTNFTIALLFDVMYARYGRSQGLQALRNILGIEFLVVPPLLNPIMYGFKLTQIRQGLLKMYRHRCKALQHS
ncbi:olfactory receptor 142-like [Pangasianodon hypophthalmus]|uniref:olfactory receptor 142-like n=1 Tax=Pangasianodon hypophthalmus TaxID=310915 RepID=UPI000F0069A3|nr:olfactory receptor 142-like [Pangasianodon hypophthalmus]